MKEFEYKIKDKFGIHARPAGLLVKVASKYSCTVEMECRGKNADCKKIFSIMSLGVKQDDAINIKISGADETIAYEDIKSFIEKNL